MEVSRGVTTRFDVGSYVLISYNSQKMNAKPPTKLHSRLKGPYLVANERVDKYSCQNLVTDEIEDSHVTRLREFRYDERCVIMMSSMSKRSWLVMVILVDLRHWPSMFNGGALMNLLTLGNRGRICVRPKCFIAI